MTWRISWWRWEYGSGRSGDGAWVRGLVDVEDDSLGEGKGFAVVDGVGGAAHVGFPGVGAGLAAAAGLFFAAEGTADLGTGWADVDVGDSAVGAYRGEEDLGLGEVLGEDGGGEALGDVVVELDGLVEGFVAEDVEDGGEGFVTDEIGLGGDFDEGWADVEGFGWVGFQVVLRPLWRFGPHLFHPTSEAVGDPAFRR